LNIYIYGNNDFTKDMHDILDYGNIRTRLDEYGVVIDINSLDELKKTIEDFPDYIYLIDESKIISENSLLSKLKFLQAKDAIEHNFLIEHGIEDIQIDSIEDIPKHIIQRIEILESTKNIGNENDNIQDSIIEIVEDAYGNDSVDAIKELNQSTYFLEDEEDPHLELDDELTSLLRSTPDLNEKKSENIIEIENVIKEIDEKEDKVSLNEDEFDENDVLSSLDNALDEEAYTEEEEIASLMNTFDTDDDVISEDDMKDLLLDLDESIDGDEYETMFETNTHSMNNDDVSADKDILDTIDKEDMFNSLNGIDNTNEILKEGAAMANDFSSLDELQESDILNALNGSTSKDISVNTTISENESIKVNLDNVSDITSLLGKLLSNKTLEITIKVKD